MDDDDIFAQPELPQRRSRMLSASSSLSSFSDISSSRHSDADSALQEGLSLIRTTSARSLRDMRPATPPPPETSATKHLRIGKMTIDFSVADADAKSGLWPVSWSVQNLVVFSRGNRVHYKNLSASDDVGQLCKLRESHGDLRLIQCGGKEQPNAVALCTTKGLIQVWDLSVKKMTTSWSTKTITSMQWNGPVLTVGGQRGTIRHFDTRIKETSKMKEQTKKVTRHQAKICSLTWNVEGKFLASGDESGLVYVWDARQNAPLDVGDLIQRRRKMQHVGAVHALAWCPWQPKLLASGDSAPDGSGTIRTWNINQTSHSKSAHPDRLELDAEITSLHFSPSCKELLSTHGPGKSRPPPERGHLDINIPYSNDPLPSPIANSVVVHSYPSLRRAVTVSAASKNIAGSVLSPNGQRIVLAVPEEMKLKVWDIWGKAKELRRSSSMLDGKGIR
ncbi:hypothetical protein AcV7_010318 [Taiwanofungus camphoratus]|nr:hypothetical protein AcV7_010318 [Antrodia cinnamomea]